MKYRRRYITPRLLESIADSPVILVSGARQTGKSTLARRIANEEHPSKYLTLDDAATLAAVRSDPAGFIRGIEGPMILDEVQHVPELLPAIKMEVDRNREPGRFLLTGSANVWFIPKVSESLAGRMTLLTLWPLSQGEIHGTQIQFVDNLFGTSPIALATQYETKADVIARITKGGYPESLTRKSRSLATWYESYLTSILQRDVRNIAEIEDITALPRLLRLLGARVSNLLNYSSLSREIGIPQTTLKRYITLLQAAYLYQPLPAWHRNLGKRLIKAPKVMINDPGLHAHLLGFKVDRYLEDPTASGPLVENFVATELQKLITWADDRYQLFHFRTAGRHEVDLVLEDATGQIVGIEVKASATLNTNDFKGLRFLSEYAGDSFHRGIVLYLGSDVIPFGENLHAVPIQSLWE